MATAELFDAGHFGPPPAVMNAAREAHTATLLANGQVLVATHFCASKSSRRCWSLRSFSDLI